MEEVKQSPMCASGYVSAEQIAQFEENCKHLYAGYNPPEKTTEFFGWITTPAKWQIKQQLQMLADRTGAYIDFSHEQVDGWIFKRRTIYFKVTGLVSRVNQFIEYYNAMRRQLSDDN